MRTRADNKYLRDLYASYTTEYLQELKAGGTLTSSAQKILDSELASRDVSLKANRSSHETVSTSAPKQQFNWLLTRIQTTEEARKVVKSAAYLFLTLGALIIIVGAILPEVAIIIIGSIHAVLALWLLISASRAAAVLLFLGLISSVFTDFFFHTTPLTGLQLLSTWISFRAILATWKLSPK